MSLYPGLFIGKADVIEKYIMSARIESSAQAVNFAISVNNIRRLSIAGFCPKNCVNLASRDAVTHDVLNIVFKRN